MTNPIELIQDFIAEGNTKQEALSLARKIIDEEKNSINRRAIEENNYVNKRNQARSIMHNI